jgi:hypothetical protein
MDIHISGNAAGPALAGKTHRLLVQARGESIRYPDAA